jgi:hypothetical protein
VGQIAAWTQHDNIGTHPETYHEVKTDDDEWRSYLSVEEILGGAS